MTHTYNITGMTCGSCVAKAKNALLKLGDITAAEVRLATPQASISMGKHVPVSLLQNALSSAGAYTITEAGSGIHQQAATTPGNPSWIVTYKPILIIAAFITGISFLIETKSGFDGENWMQNFMAGFFIVFSFFKILDLKGFVESYATYDIIASRWANWGYVYVFIELGLGISYLLRLHPLYTNAVSFLVMSISLVGVLQAVLNKRQIRCACLGSVFNLPMSTVTIIEDSLMIGMSFAMLVVTW
ncbi:MAG: cation transporter [Ferruginibacter sp.]|nr:cation transporter [Ferruginibacter sp.]